MAIPTFQSVGAASGVTDAGGAWTFTCGAGDGAGVQIGNIVILHVLQDGTTGGAVTLDSATHINSLAGTANSWTFIGTFNVGSPTSALQHLWIGRRPDTSAPTATGSNSTSEDLYMISYEFLDASSGTTLATVIENSTAGSTANGVGTSTTMSDTAVTTLGPDRLALQLCAADDDALGAAGPPSFTGETGGNWTTQLGFQSSTGTDGAVGLQIASMVTAGTIDGGTTTVSPSAGWGVVGFALIGTTPSVHVRNPAINFNDPAFV